MKTRAIAAALLVAFAPATFIAPNVLAQQPAPADDAATKAARARFQEGVEFYDKGQFENARAAFKQAYALKNHPAVLLNLAQSSLKSGHLLEASKYFAQYLKDPAGTDKPAAEKGLAEARSKLGRVEVSGPNGTEVTVDNERAGFVPIDPIDLEPGNHTIKTKTPDGATNEVTIPIGPGQAFALKAGSAPIATTKPPPDTTPPPSNPPPSNPPPDTNPPPNNPPPPDANPPPPDTTRKASLLAPPKNVVPLFILGGVAVLGYGFAIGFGVAKGGAQSSADNVEAQIKANGGTTGTCTNPSAKFVDACKTLTDNRDAVNADATIANISLGVGIAGTVGTVLYYLLAAKNEPAPVQGRFYKPVITPMFGQGVGGALLTGSF